jgi:benzoyl-CoA reductase/2-hydroxyglutaryl-CoA dehydratase subunit BcrC/BadD/HgdB
MKIPQIGALMEARLHALAEARGRGMKVVGYLTGGYVPDELIYASGAIPLCLSHGGDARSAERALGLVPNIICPFARAQLGEKLLRTNPFYTSLDLVVVPTTCQHLKELADVWEHYGMVQVFKLGVPYDCQDDFELDYYKDRLAELKKTLEALTGQAITADRLNEAIAIYNRLRGLLNRLSLLRRGPRPAISTLDFVRLGHLSMYADPVATCEALEAVYNAAAPAAAEGVAALSAGLSAAKRPRVLLTGPALAFGDYDIIKMTADAGADVVVEEMFEGVRDYRQVVEDATGPGDPLDRLARSYLLGKKPAAFARGATRKKVDFVLDLIEEFDVDGVLWYQLLCCEMYDEESYLFEQVLRERGIPMLTIESDYHNLDAGPVRTRLEAFVEIMQGGPADA